MFKLKRCFVYIKFLCSSISFSPNYYPTFLKKLVPSSKVKKAGVAATETPEEKPKTKKPLTIDNKKNKITANIVEFQKK